MKASQQDFPLRDVSVLVTRPAYAAGRLARQIIELGGTPLRQPGLTVEPVADDEPSLSHLQHSHQADFAIFTSRPAVNFGLQRMQSRSFSSHCQVLAIGQGTAESLRQAGFEQVLTPPNASSEALLAIAELTDTTIKGQRALIFCARAGRTTLEQGLQERKMLVDPVYVYQRGTPILDEAVLRAVSEDFERTIVTASSVTMLENLLQMYAGSLPGSLRERPLVVISERIAASAREAGFADVQVADNTSDAALLQTVSTLAGRMKARAE